MKKHYIFKFILLLIPVSAFILMSSSGGRSEGRSGSPGDSGNSCATCHSTGGNFNTSVEITSNIPLTGYLLNTDYTINVNTTSSSSTLGFQLTAENGSNTKIGTFSAGSGTRTVNNNKAVTQSFPSSSGDWSFTWRSPSTDLGRVTFYTAVNAADGTGGTSGDQVVTSSTSSPSLSISEANRLDFDMYPNPASEKLTIQLPSGENNATVQFYDYQGKLALSQVISSINNTIFVNKLSTGIYILKVATDTKIGVQKFIKK